MDTNRISSNRPRGGLFFGAQPLKKIFFVTLFSEPFDSRASKFLFCGQLFKCGLRLEVGMPQTVRGRVYLLEEIRYAKDQTETGLFSLHVR